MQEKEKQGVNPVENKVLLYSGKPRVRTGKDLLAFRRIPLFQVCFGITECSFPTCEVWLPSAGPWRLHSSRCLHTAAFLLQQ